MFKKDFWCVKNVSRSEAYQNLVR